MSLLFFDNRTNKYVNLLEFDHTLRMYVCGPTLYRYAHVGNYRSILLASIVYNVFTFFKKKVELVSNITDIGHISDTSGFDKVLSELDGDNNSLFYSLVHKYWKRYISDLKYLGVNIGDIVPASYLINEQINIIDSALVAGKACSKNDGIYTDVNNIGIDYSCLLHGGVRVRDFAMWRCKGKKEMVFDSKFGYGIPGWHIECFCIGYHKFSKYLSSKDDYLIDWYGGGRDLQDIHHNCGLIHNYIYRGNYNLSRVWMHTGNVNINGAKMSKESKNCLYFYPYNGSINYCNIRMAFAISGYSNDIDINDSLLNEVNNVLRSFMTRLLLFLCSSSGIYVQFLMISYIRDMCSKNYCVDESIRAKVSDILYSLMDGKFNVNAILPFIAGYQFNHCCDLKKFIIIDKVLDLNIMRYLIDCLEKGLEYYYLNLRRNSLREQSDYCSADAIKKFIVNDFVYVVDIGTYGFVLQL